MLTDPRTGASGRLAPVQQYQGDSLGVGRSTVAIIAWATKTGRTIVRHLNAARERRLLLQCECSFPGRM